MSLSSNHTVEQLNKLVSALEFSLKKGKEIFDAHANKPSKTTQARLWLSTCYDILDHYINYKHRYAEQFRRTPLEFKVLGWGNFINSQED